MSEFLRLAPYLGWGALGALLCAAARNRSLELPRIVRRRRSDGESTLAIDLGFLAAPLLGAVIAVLRDGSPVNAFAWGALAGYAGPALLNWIFDPLLKKLGAPLSDAPPPAALPAKEENE